MNEIIKSSSNEISLSWDTQEKRDLIRKTIASTVSELDLELFFNIARLTGLDPLQKQIYAIARWDSTSKSNKMAIQTSIDGYRLIASRTGVHAGTDDAIFDDENADKPKWAKVTVKKILPNGHIAEFTGMARWSEYVQTTKEGHPNSFWRRMPFGQLAKCAESLALRKAFPADFRGIYTEEEMGQADNIPRQQQGKKTYEAEEEKPIEKSEKELEEERLILIDTGNLIAKSGVEDLATWFTETLDKRQRRLIGESDAKVMKEKAMKVNVAKVNQSELDSFDSELENVDLETGEIL